MVGTRGKDLADSCVLSAGHKVDTGYKPRIEITGQREELRKLRNKVEFCFGYPSFHTIEHSYRNTWIHQCRNMRNGAEI